jgi:pimeloyl-ACP methyl ester carboxylesterase
MRAMRRVLLGGLISGVVLATAALVATWEPDRSVEALAARWAPPPSQFLELEGLRVHLRDVGPREDPAPVVLLHGTSASLHTWEGWVAELAPRHRVITLDLPGFGLTGPWPDGDLSLGRSLRVIEALLQRLGVERAVLGGNSYGGRLAWEYAALHPQQVVKLILVDAGGYPRHSTSVPLAFRAAEVPGLRRVLELVLPRGLVEKSVRDVYGDPARVTPELVDRYFELALRAGNRAALVQRMQQVPIEGDVSKLKKIEAPALVLWGGRDRLIPPDDARRFAADLPRARLAVFDALGHVPHEEDPVATVREVEAFLAE